LIEPDGSIKKVKMALIHNLEPVFLKVHLGICIFRGTNIGTGGIALGLL